MRPREIASMGPGATGFRHEALLYSSDDEFVAQTTQFIRDGLERDEAVLTVVDPPKLAALRAALDDDADRAHFGDMTQIGRNPALIIQAWRDFVAAHSADGRAVRGIGEPITVARDDAALMECHIHESLLNIAFPDDPDFWLLCPYDTRSLPTRVVDHAVANHPLVCDDVGHRLGDSHPAGADAGFGWPLPEPDADVAVDSINFDASSLHSLRRFVTVHARAAGVVPDRVGEFATAVSEIATNAIVHGHGDGSTRIWTEGTSARQPETRVVCEVRGPGRIRDPLIGRIRPPRGQMHGHGIWLANQFCDLVQIRSTGHVTTVRMHLRAGE